MPPITPQQPAKPDPNPNTGAVGSPSSPPPGFGVGIASVQQSQATANLQTTEDKYRRTKVLWFITLFLLVVTAIGAAGLGTVYGQATAANKKKFDEGYAKGVSEQEAKDKEAAVRDSLSDTRGFTAPKELGGFSMQIPKTYSISTNKQSKDLLIVLANPDKVDVLAKEQAFRLTVRNELYAKVREGYDKQAKEKRNGVGAGEDIKVSDRDAVRYTGKVDKREKDATIVLIEYLDKTILIQTDDNANTTFLEAYRNILNSIILP